MKNIFFGSLLLTCMLYSNIAAQAQDVKVKATIDTASILIGDQIRFSLSATYDPLSFQVQFPVVGDTFDHFELVEKIKTDTTGKREFQTFTQKYIITSFDSGRWTIPSFAFSIKSLKGGEPSTLQTDPLQVNVNTVAVDTSKPFKPIFGIRSAQMPLKEILKYVAAGVIALAVLAFLIYYLYRRYKRRKKEPEKIPVVVIPPHEKAIRDLESLEQKQLWQQGMEKEYHTELSDIMRSYLEEQFEIDCFEKTTSEIISQVKRVKALSTSRQLLRSVFETADMVKFAKNKPTADEHILSQQQAREAVHESYKKYKPLEKPGTGITA